MRGGVGKVGALCGRRPPLGRGEWEETPGEKGLLAGFPRLPVRPGSPRCLIPILGYVRVGRIGKTT